MTIEEAKQKIDNEMAKRYRDSEDYHRIFDNIIEERLMELDPVFMKALHDKYVKDGYSKWCA